MFPVEGAQGIRVNNLNFPSKTFDFLPSTSRISISVDELLKDVSEFIEMGIVSCYRLERKAAVGVV